MKTKNSSPVDSPKRNAKGSFSDGGKTTSHRNSDYQEETKHTRNGKLWVNKKDCCPLISLKVMWLFNATTITVYSRVCSVYRYVIHDNYISQKMGVSWLLAYNVASSLPVSCSRKWWINVWLMSKPIFFLLYQISEWVGGESQIGKTVWQLPVASGVQQLLNQEIPRPQSLAQPMTEPDVPG